MAPGSPLIIGGSGGSGTRVVARVVEAAGAYMGTRVNAAHDALDFAEFDWIWGLRLLRGGASSQIEEAFERALQRHLAGRPDGVEAWGWKHPHSYLLIPHLARRFPEMRFVHVVRDGRDVALSPNQQQLGRYGDLALGDGDDQEPARRMRFWAWANAIAADQGESLLGARYLRVGLEELCADPHEVAARVAGHAGLDPTDDLGSIVVAPRTLGTGRPLGVPADVATVLTRFGYDPAPTPDGAAEQPLRWLGQEVAALCGPVPARAHWPSVSAIVPTFDGRHLLERLMAGLRATDYPAFELVVVDNASTDDTVRWLETEPAPFPVRIVRNAHNLSFSTACNVGVAASGGDLLLLLNNDIEPLDDGWLRRMVACREERDAGIVGAILVDPDRTSTRGRLGAVQHHGLTFQHRGGGLRPTLRGLGTDVLDVLGPDEEVAAVAAACAVLTRADFEAVGGLFDGFRYGGEDVDLCLSLSERGRSVVVSGSTVVLHRPLSTRRGSPNGTREVGYANHRLLLERWGPAIGREAAGDEGGVRYCVKHGAGVTAGEVDAFIAAMAAVGAIVRPDDGSDEWLLDDVVIHLLADGRHTLVDGRCNVLVHRPGPGPPPPEARQYDVVVAADATAAEVVAAATAALGRPGGPRRLRGRSRRHDPSAGSRCVVVLGMHRSGTSAVTRVLNLLGVAVGAPGRLMGPKAGDNDKGFYEHFEIARLNNRLLRKLGGSWDAPPDLAAGWHEAGALDDLRAEAAEILREEFSGMSLWGFKDPRACLTLPFWRPLLGEASFVICHRSPLEIAASLHRRNRLPVERGVALWRRYAASAVTVTHAEERMFVTYDQVLDDALALADRLGQFVGHPGRARDASTRREIAAWIAPELRRHSTSMEALLQEPLLEPEDRTLALMLELAAVTDARPDVLRAVDAAAAQVEVAA